MSVDLTAFDAEAARSIIGRQCTMCHLLSDANDRLTDEQKTSLKAALRTPIVGNGYSHAVISRVLQGWGVKMSPDTISRHRRGGCK